MRAVACLPALAIVAGLGCGRASAPLVPPPLDREEPRETPLAPAAPRASSTEAAEAPRLTRAMLTEALARGPARVLAAIELAERPVFRDGRFVGLRLLARHDEGPTRRLFDVRPGDVITTVNGVPPRTPEDLTKAARAVLEQQAVVIELIREGKPLRLEVRAEGG